MSCHYRAAKHEASSSSAGDELWSFLIRAFRNFVVLAHADIQSEQGITDSCARIHGEKRVLPQGGLTKTVVYIELEEGNLSPPDAAEFGELGRVET